eukprot:25740-Pleurochrysis_carterae.AAC.1
MTSRSRRCQGRSCPRWPRGSASAAAAPTSAIRQGQQCKASLDQELMLLELVPQVLHSHQLE